MRRGAWSVATGWALALGLGCGGGLRTPDATVELYFRCLARDPIRSLSLLTPGFHLRHGLRFHIENRMEPIPPGVEEDDVELERARLGWLNTLASGMFARVLPRLAIEHVSREVRDDRAEVRVRVALPGLRAWPLHFVLVREGPASPWRIDSIDAGEAVSDAPGIAFVVAPTEVGRLRLSSLRRPRSE